MPLDPGDEIALHDLHVIEVEHQLHVRAGQFAQKHRDLIRPRDEIARPVARVQGLDQQGDARRRKLRGPAQVVEERSTRHVMRHARHTRHDMDRGCSQRLRIGEREFELASELHFASGHRRAAECVACRRVDADHGNAGLFQALRQLHGRHLIGKLAFDRTEVGPGSRRDAVGKSMLAEQHRDIGGKSN